MVGMNLSQSKNGNLGCFFYQFHCQNRMIFVPDYIMTFHTELTSIFSQIVIHSHCKNVERTTEEGKPFHPIFYGIFHTYFYYYFTLALFTSIRV